LFTADGRFYLQLAVGSKLIIVYLFRLPIALCITGCLGIRIMVPSEATCLPACIKFKIMSEHSFQQCCSPSYLSGGGYSTLTWKYFHDRIISRWWGVL